MGSVGYIPGYIPGYLPEDDGNKQVWYPGIHPGIPGYDLQTIGITLCLVGYTLGHSPEYDETTRCGTRVYTRVYPGMTFRPRVQGCVESIIYPGTHHKY